MDENVVLRVRAGFKKAAEKLAAAKVLLDHGSFADSVSRSYYAAFHAAEALLAMEGDEPRTHQGMKMLFGLKLVERGRIPREYAKLLNGLTKGRESSDYDVFSPIDREDAEKALRDAGRFVEVSRSYARDQGVPTDDPSPAP
ncbi:MAG: HEPN domain-containing protein [Nitrospirae bacterium]|nr:HEPN domain-containing protein [Nitrospirota bacterium]